MRFKILQRYGSYELGSIIFKRVTSVGKSCEETSDPGSSHIESKERNSEYSLENEYLSPGGTKLTY